jgi:hypothetical protein
MAADRFLDTNIPLYAYELGCPSQTGRREGHHRGGVAPGRTAISVQVLQKFHVNFVRSGHPVAEASLIVGDFFSWTVIETPSLSFSEG